MRCSSNDFDWNTDTIARLRSLWAEGLLALHTAGGQLLSRGAGERRMDSAFSGPKEFSQGRGDARRAVCHSRVSTPIR